jgi:sialic acid-specific 9-O-acetylesterase
VGFFFAQRLAQVLQMPVGLVLANKGGTMVESWLNADNMRKHTDEPTDSTLIARKYTTEWLRPLLWGNGTFHPIVNYGVRGVLYYQGCANVDHNPTTYGERLKLLAQQWRKQFSANMPMLLVEIAPHCYEGEMGTSAAFIREQQYKASLEIPNCAMVSTNDLVYPYEVRQIHPCQKRPIGERLALTALARYYGYEGVMYKHPTFERMEIKGDTCVIHLKDTYTGIVPQANYEGFEMAGADRIFYPADATYVRHNKFRLTSKAVPKPVAVRYCYRNFLLGNVKNQAVLPLIPFRTDNW